MAPIIVLLVLAAAPFVWVAIDMRRNELARRRAATSRRAAPTLVIEHVDPAGDAPALAA